MKPARKATGRRCRPGKALSAAALALALAAALPQPASGQDDTRPPELISIAETSHNCTRVKLYFDEYLDIGSVPDKSAFKVTSNGVNLGVIGVALAVPRVTGAVELTLSSRVPSCGRFTVTYTPPAQNPLQDEEGNDVAAFTATYGTPPPLVPPPSGGGGGGANDSPTADAGPDQVVWPGALVTLDGSASSDPEDEDLEYRWNQFSGPSVELSSLDVPDPTFTAPEGITAEAVLRFRLLVTDPTGRFDSDTVTVTVDPELEPPPVIYYFPHLAVGAGWQTTITYINHSSEQVTCETEFISDHGVPLLVSFAGPETVTERTDVLPPGGSVREETNVELDAPLAQGWARAECTGPVKASLLFRRYDGEGTPVGEAGVNAATAPATRFVTFAEQGEGQLGTAVAYANPSAATTAFVTFTLRDELGNELDSVVRTLLPEAHDAQNMTSLFDFPSFTGWLEITSTQPIVSLSLNAEAAPVFSSLPPGEVE